MRKYLLNEDFFEIIDSEEKAYFLGFLFADATINEKHHYVDLTLHNKDIEILNKFNKLIFINERPLYSVKKIYRRLQINSMKIVNDLVKLGCIQNKTFKLKFPNIDNKYVRDFIRGYFDGDGCVYITNKTLNFSIVGTIELLEIIQKYLIENCQLNKTKFDERFPLRKTNIRSLLYGGNIVINRIFHYLYDNSTIFLERKYLIFLSILEKKDYFCDKNKYRKIQKHIILYNGVYYNHSQLSRKLSDELGFNPKTIRTKLIKGWSIDEILNTKLNHRRYPTTSNPVLKIDKNGNIISKYFSAKSVSEELKCTIGSVYRAINKNMCLKNYYWEYENKKNSKFK